MTKTQQLIVSKKKKTLLEEKDPAKVAAAYKGILNQTITSPARHLSPEDKERWVKNFLKFVAPTLAIFFAQLAMGVDYRPAALVALLALYQSLSDLFNKWANETTYRTEAK